jgi:Flp pilus assembly protein TadD
MSRTLTLIDAAWASARELASAGRRADALAILKTLLAHPGVPAGITAKAHRLAGMLHLHADRYGAARRHLLAAAKAEPGNADTRYQLGIAFEDDPYGCDERAARRFRQATKLDPHNATYWAALGRAAVRVNKIRVGVWAVKKAVALAPTDPAVLAVVVEALREANRSALAWKVVCKARFLAPASQDIQKLWQRVKFDLACTRQPKPHFVESSRTVLPFVRLVSPCGTSRLVRRDTGTQPSPHIDRLRVRG